MATNEDGHPSPPPPLATSSLRLQPSSVVDKFVALQMLARRKLAPPSSTTSAKRQKLGSKRLAHTQLGSTPYIQLQSRLNPTADIQPSKPNVISDPPVTRPYDPLPSPGPEIHRYIASSRLLQNTTIVQALLNPECARLQLAERDVEYLRALLPEWTRNRSTTRVEADIIVDEANAIIFYPLREIGQTMAKDPDAGLNELMSTLARIGPRYKVLWLIFEEYSWNNPSGMRNTVSAGNSVDTTAGHGDATTCMGSRAHSIARLDPYAGPVAVQLNKLITWLPFTYDRRGWLSRVSHSQHPESYDHDSFPFAYAKMSEELKFETKVLFASDARCAAWLTRAIGDGIAARIENAAQAGVRRDEDGWQSREEWIWREWLNDQDSTV
ncbi:hypothetical protein BGZ58_009643 [Dissophora ornata]|nr:hypothetical protein BGZ58_009643 [Dissophora ornata]